ncbi:MAG: aminotransferase class IV [Deltaproteobacteria bacterium]|nr:aminotransferase class IV [Deltaproteobacteria bacterium]
MDMDGIIVVNGEFRKPDTASIPAMDRGFLFGDHVFEVLVAFRGHVLDLRPHISRLRESAEILKLPIPWSDEELSFELSSVAERLDYPKTQLRLVVTRGAGSSLDIPEDVHPHKIIYGFPAKLMDERLYKEGISLQARHLPYTERGPAIKTGNYLRSILALNKAKSKGFDDVLWINSQGEVTEASTANIFFIGRRGDLLDIVTPSAHSGLLQGITRQTLITLMKRAGIRVDESIVHEDELARFDEAFVCSTVKGLIPVASIGPHRFFTLRPENSWRHINRLYQTWVASELGHPVDWNSGTILAKSR